MSATGKLDLKRLASRLEPGFWIAVVLVVPAFLLDDHLVARLLLASHFAQLAKPIKRVVRVYQTRPSFSATPSDD